MIKPLSSAQRFPSSHAVQDAPRNKNTNGVSRRVWRGLPRTWNLSRVEPSVITKKCGDLTSRMKVDIGCFLDSTNQVPRHGIAESITPDEDMNVSGRPRQMHGSLAGRVATTTTTTSGAAAEVGFHRGRALYMPHPSKRSDSVTSSRWYFAPVAITTERPRISRPSAKR